jgi:hypothetical protein
MNHQTIRFSSLEIGDEFFWGSPYPEQRNWGKKRSTRTADFRPRILGKLSQHTHWSYWGANELVYVPATNSSNSVQLVQLVQN